MSSCRIIQYDFNRQAHELPIQEPMDLVFADPPYNIGVRYADDTSGDKLSAADYREWVENAIFTLSTVMRQGATLWWVCPESHADLIGPMLTRLIGPRMYRIVWHETFSQYNHNDLTQDYRFIFCHRVLGVGVTKNFDAIRVPSARMILGDKRAAGPRIPGRVWQLRRLQGTAKARVTWHPAQMPPEVLSRIVEGWTNPGDTVLDAFAGSGSMGVRCKALGRNFIGVDKSPTYCFKMRARLGVPEP